MTKEPKIRILGIRATRVRWDDPARIEMNVELAHLKNRPVVKIPLTADEATDLALDALKAVNQTRGRLKERSA